jgi:hypothetical protein
VFEMTFSRQLYVQLAKLPSISMEMPFSVKIDNIEISRIRS